MITDCITDVIASDANAVMRDRWDDDLEGLPNAARAVAWVAIKTEALKYIKEVCPEAWFRPLFETKTKTEKEN